MKESLTDYRVIKEICRKYGFRFKKGLGQNFLTDGGVIDDIIKGSGIDENTSVIEIGPGFGALTQGLIRSARSVTAIELDKTLIPVLTDIFADAENFSLVEGDVLALDLNDYIPDDNTAVAANLPYYITTPIISYLLENRFPLRSVTVMVQKEVAERMTASPGTKEYGAFTCLVNYYSDPEIIRLVPAGCFTPAPKVDSAVVLLRLPDRPKYSPADEEKYKAVVKAVFMKRRKTLINALHSSGRFGEKSGIEAAVVKCGFDPMIRGECLSIEDFIKLSEQL